MAHTRPYRPSNGSEGLEFQMRFCDHCKRDDYDNEMYCPILGAALSYQTTEPEYPAEWVVDNDGLSNPRCTAFEPKEQT